MAPFSWSRWLRSLLRPQARTLRKSRRQAPRLEELENRLAPATFIWTGAGTNPFWSNGANWSLNGAAVPPNPQGLDDLVFPAGAAQLNNVNDFVTGVGATATFNSITISDAGFAAPSAYTLRGNDVVLGDPNTPGSGFIIVNSQSARETIRLNIQLAAPAGSGPEPQRQFITVQNGADLTITGHISGTTGVDLTKDGSGTLILTADNSGFTGPITVATGILQITNANALGDLSNGTTVQTNAQLQVNAVPGAVFENAVINGPGPGNDGAILSTAGQNLWFGTVALDSDSTLGASLGSSIDFRGQVSDLGAGHNLTKEGKGTVLFSTANTYRGQTIVNDGILEIQDPNALGLGDDTPASGTVVTQNIPANKFGTLEINDPNGVGFTVQNELLTLNGFGSTGPFTTLPPNNNGALDSAAGDNVWTGDVILGSPAPDGQAAWIGVHETWSLTVTGVVEDQLRPGTPLNKVSPGTLIFTHDNTYTGPTRVWQGILEIEDSQALGSGSAKVDNGASLELAVDALPDSITGTTNTLSVSNPLTLSGYGANGLGALYSASGINTYTGTIAVVGDTIPLFDQNTASIGVAADPNPSPNAGYFPTYDPVTGNALTGDYSLTIQGADLISGSVPFAKFGAGQLILPQSNTGWLSPIDVVQGWVTIGDSHSLGGVVSTTVFNPITLTVPLDQNRQPTTTVEAGAALHLYPIGGNDIDVNENLVLAGSGIAHTFKDINAQGALENLAGRNTVHGNITFQGQAGVGVEQVFGASASRLYFTDGDVTVNPPDPATVPASGVLSDRVPVLQVERGSGGGPQEDDNVIDTGATSGTITIKYQMYNLPDSIDVYYGVRGAGGTRIYSSGGPVSGSNVINVPYGPGATTLIDIVVNAGGSSQARTQWYYTATINPAVPAAGGIAKLGSQLLGITEPGTYGGPVDVRQGVLLAQNDTALGLGTAATSVTTVEAGAALALGSSLPPPNPNGVSLVSGSAQSGIQVWGEHLILNGPGNTTLGTSLASLNVFTDNSLVPNDVVIAADHQWHGPVTLNADSSVLVPAGGRLILSGGIDDATNAAAAGSSLTKVGDGELVLAGAGSYRGTTYVGSGPTGNPAVPENQLVAAYGSAGTFNLTFNGQTTASLPLGASAAQVQQALNGLSSIGGMGGQVTVTQTGSYYNVAFGGNLLGTNVPPLTAATTGNAIVDLSTLNDGGTANSFYNNPAQPVDGGVLTVANSRALGATSGGTIVQPGSSLQLQGNVTVAGEPLNVAGSGISTTPAPAPATWFQQGPAPIGSGQTLGKPDKVTGRVTGVSVDPSDPNTIYVSTAGGGAWKTSNGGKTWYPLFELGSDPGNNVPMFSGAIAVDPLNPLHVYLGTGEANNSTDSYYGTGVYESVDGGKTWTVLVGETDQTSVTLVPFPPPAVPPPYQSAIRTYAYTASGNPLFGQAVSAIAVDPFEEGTIYVATSDRAANHPTPGGSAGIWRYRPPLDPKNPVQGDGWFDMTATTSDVRYGVQPWNTGFPAPPGTPGPDDDFRLSFPQSGVYSDVAISEGGVLYMALGTPDGNVNNAVYRCDQPQAYRNGTSLRPIWYVGNGNTYPLHNSYGTGGNAPYPTNIAVPATRNGNIKLTSVTSPDANGFLWTRNNSIILSLANTALYASNVWVPPPPIPPNPPAVTEGLTDIQKSTDGGQTWAATPTTPPNYLGTQGHFDSTIRLHNGIVYVAGELQVLQSADGGTTWVDITVDQNGFAPHQDFHTLTPWGNSLLASTDGGVWSLDIGSSKWTDLNSNLNVTQLNGLGIRPSDPTTALVGSQSSGIDQFTRDNAQPWQMVDDLLSPTNTPFGWSPLGGRVQVSPNNPLLMYAFVTNSEIGNQKGVTPDWFNLPVGIVANLRKSIDGGKTWTTITWTTPGSNFPQVILPVEFQPIAPPTPIYSFTQPVLLLDPLNDNHVLVGRTYAPNDPGLPIPLGGPWAPRTAPYFLAETNDGGTTWHDLKSPIQVTAMAIASYQGPYVLDRGFALVQDKGINTYDADTIYIAGVDRNDGNPGLYVTKNHGVTWINRTPGTGSISDIAVDPRNRDIAYVTSSAPLGSGGRRLFMTTNAGQSWTDITGAGSTALPDVPTWKTTVDPRTGYVYVGTEEGVYWSNNGGSSWQVLGLGMANVSVRDMVLDVTQNTLSVATYGRGVYTIYLDQTVANAGGFNAVAGSGVWTGPVTLSGDAVIGAAGPTPLSNPLLTGPAASQVLQNGTAAAQINIVGTISDQTPGADYNVTKVGLGNVILSGTNTYGGVTEVAQGILFVHNPQALGGLGVSEVQTLTLSGTDNTTQLNLTFNGFTATVNLTNTAADAGLIQAALNGLPSVASTGGPNAISVTQTAPGVFQVTFGGNMTGFNQAQIVAQVTGGPGSAGVAIVTNGTGGTLVDTLAALGLQSDLALEPVQLNGDGIPFNGHNTGALFNASNFNTFTGRLILATSSTIGVASGSQLTIGAGGPPLTGVGFITDSGDGFTLTKELTGTLVLAGPNSYGSGAGGDGSNARLSSTFVNQGALDVANPSALGVPGNLTTVLTGAALQMQGGISVPNQTLRLSGDGISSTGALEGVGGSNHWLGNVYLAQDQGQNPLTGKLNYVAFGALLANPIDNLTVDGVIGPNNTPLGLTKVDAGTVVLTNANAYGGLTTVSAGSLRIKNAQALGTTTNGTLVQSGAALELDRDLNGVPIIVTGERVTLNGLGAPEIQTVTVTGTGGAFTLTFNGKTTSALPYNATAGQVRAALNNLSNIGGAGGTATVTQVGNVYTVLFGGTLANSNLPQMTALGAGGVSAFVSTFRDGAAGALRNDSPGNNTWAAPVILQTDSGIGADPGTVFTVSGVVQDTSPAASVPAPALDKQSLGTVVLTAANTYTGPTFVNEGILNIRNAQALGAFATEVQAVTLAGPLTGSFTLTFNGATTTTLSSDYTKANFATNVQNALNALSTIGGFKVNGVPGSVTVTTAGSAFTVTFGGSLANRHLPQMTAKGLNGTTVTVVTRVNGSYGTTVSSGATLQMQGGITVSTEDLTLSGPGTSAIQQFGTSGPFTLTFNGQTTPTLPFGASDAQVAAALNALSTVGGAGGSVQVRLAGGLYSVIFGGSLAGQPLPTMTGTGLGPVIVADPGSGTHTTQTFLVNGTAGSYTLSFNGSTTTPLPYNASPAQVAAALAAVPSVAGVAGTVSVTLTGGVYTVTFGGGLALGQTLPALTGTGIVLTVTPGGPGALDSASGSNTWDSSITLAGNTSIGADVDAAGNAATLTIDKAIAETTKSNLTKVGFGKAVLSGPTSNTFTGVTTVNDGTLQLNKSGGATAVGSVVIGDNNPTPATPLSDVLQLLGPNQITPTSTVTIVSDGFFDLNGQQQTIGGLTMTGGVVSLTGPTAVLTLNGNLTAGADATGLPAVILDAGTLSLGSATRTFTISGPFSSNPALANVPYYADVVISAVIGGSLAAGIIKAGPGTLALTAHDTFPGVTTISQGTLLADATPDANTVGPISLNGGTLGGNGSVGTVVSTAAGGTVMASDFPPVPPGVLNINVTSAASPVTWNKATKVYYALNLPANGPSDQITVNGPTGNTAPVINLNNATLVGLVDPTIPTDGSETFTILQVTNGTISGKFFEPFSPGEVFIGGQKFNIAYLDDSNLPSTTPTKVVLTRALDLASMSAVASVNPSVYGQPVTFTVTVTPEPGTGPIPNGSLANLGIDSVTFTLDGTFSQTVPLTNGQAAISETAFTGAFPNVGQHVLTATFSGDPNFAAATLSPPLVETVNQDVTTVSLSASDATPVPGETVTVTATVFAQAPGSGTPTGTASFTLDGIALASGPVNVTPGSQANTAVAQVTLPTLTVGTHRVRVSYSGDTNFKPFATQTDLLVTVTKATATETLSASPASPSVFGQAVTFTADVSGIAGFSTAGTVSFYDGGVSQGNLLGTFTLDSTGGASVTTAALAVRAHVISAVYSGNTSYNSTTKTLNYTVIAADTQTFLSSSPNPSAFGQPVKFSALVSTQAPGSGTPAGSVTFFDGGTTLGTAVLDSTGTAQLSYSALSAGMHANITAKYNGSASFNPSTSAPLTQAVQTGTATTITSAPAPSVFGQPVTFSATVKGAPAGNGNPPAGETVTFYDGPVVNNVVLGTGTLDTTATATLTIGSLSVGTHTVYAVYGGDLTYFSSTSQSPVTQVVNKDGTTTTVTTSQTPSGYGTSVTFTANVQAAAPGAGSPTGVVTFYDGAVAQANTLGNGSLDSNGTATLSTNSLGVGTHTVLAVYSGDGNFVTSQGTVAQAVNKATSTTKISGATNTAVFGQSLTFTATVTPSAGTPTGTVTFYDGAVLPQDVLGSSSLAANGTASVTTTALTVGAHGILAVYLGDANTFGSQSTTPASVTVGPDATTTSVTSSANPSLFGQTVTFTATVTANAPGGGTPAGSVTFFDGTVSLGTALLGSNGSASLPTSGLNYGSHSITATYGGSGNYTGSTSTALTQAVQVGTVIAITSSGPTVFGQPVTFTATVSVTSPATGSPPAGETVTFYDGAVANNVVLGTGTLDANGTATLTVSSLSVATHQVNAAYAGDGTFIASSTTTPVSQVVSKDATTTALTSSLNPSVYGQSVTFTATVTANAPGAGTPTGTVSFYDGSVAAKNLIGGGTLDGSGTASASTGTLNGGAHTIIAVYAGDADFVTSQTTLSQTVGRAATTTTVSAAPATSVFGQSVTFTATVAGSAGTPTGTVNFYDGAVAPANLLGSGSLDQNGKATFATTALGVGSHNILAAYTDDNNFLPSQTVTPAGVTVGQADTTATVVSSVNPSVFGHAVTFTATVSAKSPGGGTPAGTVTFYDNTTTVLGTGNLDANGVATLTTSSLPFGTHSITVVYGGSGNYNGTTSAALAQTVEIGSTVTISSSGASVYGQPVTFTATVSATAPATGNPPAGETVTFYDGSVANGNILGTGTTDANGTATLTTGTLTVGTHNINARYPGDGTFLPGDTSAAPVSQTVGKASTTTSVTAGPAGAVTDQTVTLTATVAAQAPGAGQPTASVTFYDGAVSPQKALGIAFLGSNGKFTASTNALGAGTHTIIAVYSGDGNFVTSQGMTSFTVAKAATTTAVSAAPTVQALGQSVTFTATVAVTAPGGGTATGTVTFADQNGTLGSGTLDGNGRATFSTTALSLGTHNVTATYNGDTNYVGSASTAAGVTILKGTTTTVGSSAPTSSFGQAVTLSATVAALPPATGHPSGEAVSFFDGGNLLGQGTLSAGGVATLTTSALGVGQHHITASYAGDGAFLGSTSAAFTQTVNADATTTVLSASPPSITYGQSVTLTAGVTAQAPGGGTPTGTLTFYDGAVLPPNALATFSLGANGTVAFSTKALTGGTHTLIAVYSGDGSFAASQGTATEAVAKAATSMTFSLSPPSSVYGQPVTFSAAVTSSAGVPTGTANFYDGSNLIGSAPLDATGHATFVYARLLAGTHTLTANCSGDVNFAASRAPNVLTETVGRATTTTQLFASTTSSVYSQAVTFTAVVAAAAPSTGIPAGTVSFYDGPTFLTSVNVDANGRAVYATGGLAVGPHHLTAVFSGNGGFLPSQTNGAVPVTVSQDGTTTTVTSSANPSLSGQAVTFTAAVAAAAPGGAVPTGAVTFFIDGVKQATLGLSNGRASMSTSTLSVGNHTVSAVYSGDGNFFAGQGSLTQTVNVPAATQMGATVPGRPNGVGVNQLFNLMITALDGIGRPVSGYSNQPVTVTLTSGPPGGSLLGTLTGTFVNGQVTLSNLSVTVSGMYMVHIVSGTLTPLDFPIFTSGRQP